MALNFKTIWNGLKLFPKSTSTADSMGDLEVVNTDGKLRYNDGNSTSPVVTETHTATLENKTISADDNTISELEVDNLKAGVLNVDLSTGVPTDQEVPSALAVKTYTDASSASVQTDVDDLIDLSGVPANSTDLGTFTGTVINDNSTIKQALQDLETFADMDAFNLAAHVTDTTDAHDASAISVVPTGNLAATDVQGALNELQTDIDTINAAGYVVGPASSANNSLARFDGLTGKLIKDSGIFVDDSGILTSANTATISNVQISSGGVTGTGGNLTLQSNGVGTVYSAADFNPLKKLKLQGVADAVSTGANVTLPNVSGGYLRLTNPGLVSIDMIDATSSNGQKLIIENLTGNPITINNKTGATATNQIVTGSGGPLTLLNEASIELLYDGGTNSKWQVIGGTGSGGGQSLDTIFQLTGMDFSQWVSGNNATFLGGGSLSGTFSSETVAPLNGISSYKYTQASGSLNDYIASPIQSVPLRFRGQTNTASFVFSYDGNNNDIVPVIYDVTNASVIIGSVNNDGYALLGTNGGVKTYRANFTIPLSCTQIRVGFQIKVLNSGKILRFDDIEVGSDLTVFDTFDTGSIGEITPFAGPIDTEYYLECAGQAVSRITYGDLFNKIGITHGQGDGSTTFNLPDYRGQFLRGRIAIANVVGSGTASSNQATFTNHGFNRTGLRVRLASGALTGLAASTNYYVIVVDANTLAFATTRANALANTRIAISGTNTAVIQQWEDADASTRQASNVGGNTGTNVGSIQEDKVGPHNHITDYRYAASGSALTYLRMSDTNAFTPAPNDAGYFAGYTGLVKNTADAVETRPTNVTVNYGIRYRSNISHIITPTESFSTDTAQLTYAPSTTYTLSTLANAPVGTYITFTYAANSNTRTQTTTRPTQTDADMNVNGIQIFTRAYNANSTAAQPAVFAIQIGKGLKGVGFNLYKNVGKVTSGNLDYYTVVGSSTAVGARSYTYNESTGVLVIDSGNQPGSITSALFTFSDALDQTSGYLVINASKSPSLVGVPQLLPRIATLSDVKPSGTAGGTATAGAYQTRTLNTIDDPTGIVTSLASNQFTLPAGEYYIEATAPVFYANAHKIKLRNITDSVDSLIGTVEYSPDAVSPSSTISRSFLTGKVVLASPKTFELQHRVGTSRSPNGFGTPASFGDNETYTICKIVKIK